MPKLNAYIKSRLHDLVELREFATSGYLRAILQPRHTYFYAHGDLFDIAAAYAFHIAQAQACFDGNKRTGVAAAFLFLEMNAVSTDFEAIHLYDAMIAVAARRMDKMQLAQLLRQLCPAD